MEKARPLFNKQNKTLNIAFIGHMHHLDGEAGASPFQKKHSFHGFFIVPCFHGLLSPN
jgi:hypothetical protein